MKKAQECQYPWLRVAAGLLKGSDRTGNWSVYQAVRMGMRELLRVVV